MRVSMCLQIPLQDPNLQGYRDRLQTDVPRLIREGRLSVSYPMTVHGPAQEVLFDRESSLFPTQNEQDAWHLMTTIEIDLNFYRVPRTSSDIRRQGYLESDLRIDLTERGMKDPPSRRAKVRYDIKTQKLLLCCSYDASEYRLSSTGRIVAVPDLAGVQVIITFKDIRYGRGSVNPRSKLEVESLYLSMSGGQHIQIRGGDLQKYEDRGGWPHYAYMLPGAKD